jgi:hypothetical protein
MVRVRLVGDGPMVEFRLPLGDNRGSRWLLWSILLASGGVVSCWICCSCVLFVYMLRLVMYNLFFLFK